jgi:hypothetical protein
MYGIIQQGHADVATSLFPTVAMAVEALRNAPPGSRVVACDSQGNPLVPAAPARSLLSLQLSPL